MADGWKLMVFMGTSAAGMVAVELAASRPAWWCLSWATLMFVCAILNLKIAWKIRTMPGNEDVINSLIDRPLPKRWKVD